MICVGYAGEVGVGNRGNWPSRRKERKEDEYD
jgi:hypothetical protein